MSSDCSWTPHISKMVEEAKTMASWVLSVFRDRSQFLMMTLFKSMVRSKLEYCCPLWNPSKISDIQAIESIQRQFTRRITSCKDFDYWERLKKLKILSLQRRRERYTIIHTWKILHKEAPNSIDMEFYSKDRLGIRARVPTYNHKAQRSIATAYEDSFGVKAARLWNILPKSVNQQPTLEAFKTALETYLDRLPDTPPVPGSPGYTPQNSNSILDVCCGRGDIGGRA